MKASRARWTSVLVLLAVACGKTAPGPSTPTVDSAQASPALPGAAPTADAAVPPAATAAPAVSPPAPADVAAKCDTGGCKVHRITPAVQALVAAAPQSRVGMEPGLTLAAGEIITFDDTSTADDISTIRLLPGTKALSLGHGHKEPIDLTAVAELHGLLTLDLEESAIRSLAPLAGLPLVELRLLNDTGIQDFAPLSSLRSMKVLALSNCGLTSLEPLAGMSSVQKLDVGGNRGLTSLAGIETLQGLKELELTFTSVKDCTPLARLPALEKVRLYGFKLVVVPDLAGVKSLGDLDLGHNDLVDIGPLRRMTGLRRLALMQNEHLKNLAPLSSLAHLEELDLQSTAVESLEPLAKLPALRRLLLNGAPVKSLAPLASIKTLRSLNVTRDFGHEAELDALQKALPQLQITRW